MKPGIYQRIDGTVYWLHEDERWQYLSPLFGEWLEVFDQPDNGELKKYPRNLEVPNANSDWAEDDTAIRNLLRPILGEAVDGDSDGVPGIVTLVEMAVERLTAARAAMRAARPLVKAWRSAYGGFPTWSESGVEILAQIDDALSATSTPETKP